MKDPVVRTVKSFTNRSFTIELIEYSLKRKTHYTVYYAYENIERETVPTTDLASALKMYDSLFYQIEGH